jgi:hypothetical protein
MSKVFVDILAFEGIFSEPKKLPQATSLTKGPLSALKIQSGEWHIWGESSSALLRPFPPKVAQFQLI